MTNRAPLIVAIVLLLLPVPYVGSYFALVTPGGHTVNRGYVGALRGRQSYRVSNVWCEQIFYPLEQVDRKLRPGAWEWWRNDLPEVIDP